MGILQLCFLFGQNDYLFIHFTQQRCAQYMHTVYTPFWDSFKLAIYLFRLSYTCSVCFLNIQLILKGFRWPEN